MATVNEIYLTNTAVASGYIDYWLRSVPASVQAVRPDRTIAFTGSDGVTPVLDAGGNLVLTSTSANQTISIPFMDIRPGGYALQATTAAKKKVQIDINQAACLADGHQFNISVERYEVTDTMPKIDNFVYYFDSNCTFTDAQKIALIMNEVNTRPNADVVATANGTTGIFLEAVTAGVSFEASASGGLINNSVTVQNAISFGTGATLIAAGFSATGINPASTYKIIVIRYEKRIRWPLSGAQLSQKVANGDEVLRPKELWAAFELTNQDSNYTALTTILVPSELRFRRMTSLTPVNS